LVERCLLKECGIERGERLLVGVSGGPDSMALLDVLARLAPKREFSVVACGVDHGLRPAAAAELALAAEHATRLGVAFFREHVVVDGSRNVQAGAREARYGALRRVAAAEGARFVVTAHHADDRAETVLQRLLRGAGPRGLAVLRPRSSDLLRPMIRARRSDVLAHLERHGLACAEDPSNKDQRFLRTRVRHEVLPLLESLSPEIVRHLVALADQLGELEGVDDAPAAVRDEAGALVALNREQAAQLRQARAQGNNGDRARLRVPLSGGRELVLDRRSGAPLVRGRTPGGSRQRASGSQEPSD
jgi:tRNA(Ile)-lysidine synthase